MILDLSDRADATPIDWGDLLANRLPQRFEWIRVSYRTLSVVLWPNDKAKRDHFLASVAGSAMDYVLKSPPPAQWPKHLAGLWVGARQTIAASIEQHDLLPHGNMLDAQRITHPDFDFSKWEDPWAITATILWVMRAIDLHHRDTAEKGASLRKAIDILDYASHWNRQKLEGAWYRFKSVSHILVAAQLLTNLTRREIEQGRLDSSNPTARQGYWFMAGLPFTLGVARDWQRWLISYRPHAAKRPLTTLNQIWALPPDDGPPYELVLPPPVLDGKLFRALQNYRARKPG